MKRRLQIVVWHFRVDLQHWAPRDVNCICCFLTKRLLATWSPSTSDNFFIPLMAALGNARSKERAKAALEDRKRKLIEMLRASDDPDPLLLMGGGADSLETIQAGIRSNIGRKQRGVVYTAWVRYFLRGAEDPSHPVDWRDALVSE
jgi:hypothetical protein